MTVLMDLIPMGPTDPVAVSIVAANLQAIIGVNADIQSPRPEPDFAYLPERHQYDSMKIIKALSLENAGAPLKMGITALDICTPILTFVYGESQLGGSSALISIRRIQSTDLNQTYERVAKIGIHEVGHIFGLEHCWKTRCLMHFSRNIDQLDTLPLGFCSACGFETARRLRILNGKHKKKPPPHALD